MSEQKKHHCPLCKEGIPVYQNEKGEWKFSEHTANDAPVLCEYSGMVAIGTPDTHLSDMVI